MQVIDRRSYISTSSISRFTNSRPAPTPFPRSKVIMRCLYLSIVAAIAQLAAHSSAFQNPNLLVDSRNENQIGDLTTSIKV